MSMSHRSSTILRRGAVLACCATAILAGFPELTHHGDTADGTEPRRVQASASVRATAIGPDGKRVADGVPVRASGIMRVTAYGFAARERVTIRLAGSDPAPTAGPAARATKGAQSADDGTVRFTYPLSPELPRGTHRILIQAIGTRDPKPGVTGNGNVSVVIPDFSILTFATG